MLRSLYSGISGMRNHQTRMDVTGNNIANVNTNGYKSSRVNFQDTLSQTVRSAGNGTNPAQVGSGMSVGSVSNNFTQGPMQSTGRTLDLGIQGNGFFVVSDGTNEFYTREGIFFVDKQGFLVNGEGLRVQSLAGQDIRVLNGPVSTINIGPDGAIAGTNTAGQPLKFSNNDSQAIITPAQQSSIKGAPKYTTPKVEEATIKGIAMSPVTQPLEEAMVRGDSNSPDVAPLGITDSVTPIDMSTDQLTLKYSDGTNTYTATLNTGLTQVKSWYDLASQLQNAINTYENPPGSGTFPLKDKVIVSYDGSPNGGLVFQTKTSNVTPGVIPSIEIGGAGVKRYMGGVATSALSDTGKEVVTKDWTGKTFYIDTGNGWEQVTTVDDFSKIGGAAGSTGLDAVTSGEDLAQKLQALLDARTTIPGTNITVPENMTATNATAGNVTITGKYSDTSDGTVSVVYSEGSATTTPDPANSLAGSPTVNASKYYNTPATWNLKYDNATSDWLLDKGDGTGYNSITFTGDIYTDPSGVEIDKTGLTPTSDNNWDISLTSGSISISGVSGAVTLSNGDTSATYNGLTIDVSDVISTGTVQNGDTWTYNVKADKPSTNVAVTWNIDHLEFSTVGTPKDGSTIPQIRIKDAVDLIGYVDRTEKGVNSADWSEKDFFIEYNGAKYTFTAGEKKEAGFGNIISGESLKIALEKLIDKKIGENKIKVDYMNDGKLVLQTIDNGEIGETPSVNIGGSHAADLIGDKPDKVDGEAASVTPPPQDTMGVIKLVTFQNPEGLEKAGRNLFGTSVSSGEPKQGQANQSGFGTINSGYLEMSNVDLTEEFTNMITTQRGYQANARVITVSDSLLEELIQLKR
ncbi:protein of unknown function DUF1078 domain protein [Desulforamulus reducens MI-1]|uniref:Flagellar hook protein FlgE n=1 Tax=Desulforamulus reducens (strain ATCC BAA-1160 / DSM 100696 / MI-1) TaxID=349161 RepID=A4J757_DESRM|nr:flagellar hook-basal body complex protein [Desulforamulus reducens]ABO50910.1 protein of unknown function DUF1078 domain protein [Desulforamulus reducens MI-1]